MVLTLKYTTGNATVEGLSILADGIFHNFIVFSFSVKRKFQYFDMRVYVCVLVVLLLHFACAFFYVGILKHINSMTRNFDTQT